MRLKYLPARVAVGKMKAMGRRSRIVRGRCRSRLAQRQFSLCEKLLRKRMMAPGACVSLDDEGNFGSRAARKPDEGKFDEQAADAPHHTAYVTRLEKTRKFTRK